MSEENDSGAVSYSVKGTSYSPNPAFTEKFTVRILVAVFILCLSVGLRAKGIRTSEPQVDEIHWLTRSVELGKRFNAGRYFEITSHIGHPGIPPALVMAGSQALGAKIFGTSLEVKKDRLLDLLSFSRIGCALISSLAPVLLFLFAAPVLGTGGALFAAILLALDPVSVGLSQLAHLDGMQTTFVVLTVGFYFHAVRRGSIRLKLLSGVAWGLSIATKPTSLALIPAFMLWRISREFFGTSVCGRKECSSNSSAAPRINLARIVDWSDVWTVLTGQIVLCAVFTRLWKHDSDYLHRLHIVSFPADLVYATGLALNEHAVLGYLLLTVAGGAVLLALRRLRETLSQAVRPRFAWQLQLLLVLVFCGVTLLFLPQVWENLIRFWSWVGGLSKTEHRAYGAVVVPPRFGYLGLIGARIPTLSLLLICLGLIILAFSIFRRRHERIIFGAEPPPVLQDNVRPSAEFSIARQDDLLLLAFLVALLWGGLLSVSPKQAFRYFVPVVPLLYIFAAFGWQRLWDKRPALLRRLNPSPHAGRLEATIHVLCFVPPLLVQELALLTYAPHQLLFFNAISGGLQGAVSRVHSFPVAGQNEAIEYLVKQAESREIVVAVEGDLTSLQFLLHRKHPEAKKRVRFIYSPDYSETEYLLRFPMMPDSALSPRFEKLTPVMKYSIEGINFAEVYSAPEIDLSTPYSFQFERATRLTGSLRRMSFSTRTGEGIEKNVLAATRGVDPDGYLFGSEIRLKPGKYTVSVSITALDGGELGKPDAASVRVDFGKQCSLVITTGVLAGGAPKVRTLECVAERPVRRAVRVYWPGNQSVAIDRISIVDSAAPPGVGTIPVLRPGPTSANFDKS